MWGSGGRLREGQGAVVGFLACQPASRVQTYATMVGWLATSVCEHTCGTPYRAASLLHISAGCRVPVASILHSWLAAPNTRQNAQQHTPQGMAFSMLATGGRDVFTPPHQGLFRQPRQAPTRSAPRPVATASALAAMAQL
jgi:hypothetical protein